MKQVSEDIGESSIGKILKRTIDALRPESDRDVFAWDNELRGFGVVRVLHRVCVKAKLDDVTPLTLRHTFASVAGDLGFSELTIAGMLGHSARGVTQRYVHLDKALIVAANEVAAAVAQLLDEQTRAPSISHTTELLTQQP